MSALALFKLFLIAFAVVGIVYACSGSGLFRSEQRNWWASLPGHKKVIFGSAVGATLLQALL